MPQWLMSWDLLALSLSPARRRTRRSVRQPLCVSRATTEPLESRQLLSSTWFVSPSGSDQNPGTFDQPFQTIQHAANLAGPGDTVDIRGGVYRETVSPANSGTSGNPITFQAYNDETVVLDGANPLTGWTQATDHIYQADDPTDLGFGFNQVFVNGKPMTEARWPNTTALSHPALAVADGGGGGTLTDNALSSSGVNWTGGLIHIVTGQGWVAQTATINSDSGNTLTFTLGGSVDPHAGVQPGNTYYLTGKLQALDSPGEWFRDSSGKLSLWTPDGSDPDANSVEVKARAYGFNLSGKSNIAIKGVNLFACTIAGNNSGNVLIDHVTAQYVSQFVKLSNGWQPPNNTGIVLSGNNNAVTNSVVAFSAGDGILLLGRNNVARNNIVHDCDYGAYDCAGIRTWGSNDTIANNTVYNCGRDGIKFAMTTNTQVTGNLVHDVMLQTADGGAIYTFGTDGSGSNVAYNRVYSVHSGGWGAAGLYLDNNSHNFSIHNNNVTNVDIGLKMNPTSYNEQVVDNTLIATMQSVASYGSRDMSGSKFVGNVFNNTLMIGGSVKMQDNVSSGDTSGVGSAGASIDATVPLVLASGPVTAAPPDDTVSAARTGGATGSTAAPTPAAAPASPAAAATPPAAQQVQADSAQLAADRKALADALAAGKAAVRSALVAAKSLLAADRAKIKADRGNRDLLKADRAQFATDQAKGRSDAAAAKVKAAQDLADVKSRLKVDQRQLQTDKRQSRKKSAR